MLVRLLWAVAIAVLPRTQCIVPAFTITQHSSCRRLRSSVDAHSFRCLPPAVQFRPPSARVPRPVSLISVTATAATDEPPMFLGIQLKWIALVLLIFQNAAAALLTRQSRLAGPAVGAAGGVLYAGSVAVLLTEVAKVPVCLAMMAKEGQLGALPSELMSRDTVKCAGLSVLYTIQNILYFVALSNLQAATYQVLGQMKNLSTAFFWIVILKGRLLPRQWLSLLLLSCGVALVQLDKAGAGPVAGALGDPLVGVTAVIVSSLMSGFANVYLEKMMKGTRGGSIWLRNLQLCLFSIPISALYMMRDPLATTSAGAAGLLIGFNPIVWSVVLVKAAGGLLVAASVKYADNILKSYATAVAIIFTCIVSVPLFGFVPTVQFNQGMALVIASIVLYNKGIQFKFFRANRGT